MRSIKDIFLLERDMPNTTEEFKAYLVFKKLLDKKETVQIDIIDDASNTSRKKNVNITRESLVNYYFFYKKFIDTTSFEKEIYALTDEFLNSKNSTISLTDEFQDSVYSTIPLSAGNFSRKNISRLLESDDHKHLSSDIDESEDDNAAIKDITSTNNIAIEQNDKREKTEIVKKVVNSKTPEEFSKNLFYYLYKKLIDNKAIIRKFEFEVELDDVISAFKSSLNKNQACLTVNFGQLFEEIFREKVFNTLGRSSNFEVNLNHNSKKVSIVLLHCCNEKFKAGSNNASKVYEKISNNSVPTPEDYIKDYNNLKLSGENILEENVASIIEKYRSLLGIENNNDFYCDDAEKDPIFNAPSNSPFDFCARHNKLNINNKVAFFDLKAHNVHTKGSSCLVKGATGSNGGKLNSALKFINDMLDNAIQKNFTCNILFFGLIQISFELNFDSAVEHDIIIKDVGDRIATAKTSAEYSLDKGDFYISNDSLNKTSSSLLSNQSDIAIVGEAGISAKLEFQSIKATRNQSYKDKIIDALNVAYDNNTSIEDYFKNSSVDNICRNSTKLQILFDPDFFNEIFNIIYSESDEDAFFNKLRNDKFNCKELFGLLYDRIFETVDGGPRGHLIATKRTLSNILSEIFNGKDKIENYTVCKSYLEDKGCSFKVEFTINRDTCFPSFVSNLVNRDITRREDKIKYIRGKLIEKVESEYVYAQVNREEADLTDLFYQKQSFTFESIIRKNKSLKEVFSYLFKKIGNLSEGALGGHMMHPYEALDMTPNQLISRIKKYGIPQKLIEKVDGQNLFFTVDIDGTLLFARNKEDMTHEDLVDKFTGHPAEKPFIEGGNAIKAGVDSLLRSVDKSGIVRLFHPSEGVRTFVNFEIMHPEKPNQIIYDEKYIVFHGIVDYKDGREEVSRSNQDQRIHELVTLMSDGVSAAGFVLASNREVDLNSLTDVQISEYTNKIREISKLLKMSEEETLGTGIMNIIDDEIKSVGVSLSNEALIVFKDYIIKGEDSEGRKIASKDWTKFLSKEDSVKLRTLGLTSAEKVRSKIGQILQPFKVLFVELGIDLLKGVKSSYMSDKMNDENILSIRDKLQTAITDLASYMDEVPEEDWPSSIRRLIPHVELISRKGLDNIVSSAVEGGVYNSNDSLLKVTGGFAPMNQIIGAAYRDRDDVFKSFKEKFIKQESSGKSLKSVFNLIF